MASSKPSTDHPAPVSDMPPRGATDAATQDSTSTTPLLAFNSSWPTDEEFADEERQKLIAEIHEITNNTGGAYMLPILWLADKECLKTVVQDVKKNPDIWQDLVKEAEALEPNAKLTDNTTLPPYGGWPPDQGFTTLVTKIHRWIQFNEECVITHDPLCDVAHLISWTFWTGDSELGCFMGAEELHKKQQRVWRIVQRYWGDEFADNLKRCLGDISGLMDDSNLVTFSACARKAHGQLRFALKPEKSVFNEQRNIVRTRFYWLCPRPDDGLTLPSNEGETAWTGRFPSLKSNGEDHSEYPFYHKTWTRNKKYQLYNFKENRMVQNGDIVDIRGGEWDVLQFQWILQRLHRLAAQVEPHSVPDYNEYIPHRAVYGWMESGEYNGKGDCCGCCPSKKRRFT